MTGNYIQPSQSSVKGPGLDQMVMEEKLKIKLNGKQSSEQELAGLDKDHTEIEAEAKATGEKAKQSDARLKELNGSLTTAEAKAQFQQFSSENKKLGERLKKLENNQGVRGEERA